MLEIGWFVDRFSSVRFTISICILLAMVSLLGTVIPQNLGPQEYAKLYGDVLGPWMPRLGIVDLYHSAGFVFLLCLLATNLVACTAKRFPAVWRSLRREISVPSDTEFKTWRNRDAFTLDVPSASWEEHVREALKNSLRKTCRETVLTSGVRVFLCERNRISRIGPYLAHVSILLILSGALIGARFGFKGMMILPEGATENSLSLREGNGSLPLDFQIRCNRFLIDFYPNGAPKEYRSEVSILNNRGEQVQDADIRVNHPMTYRGITFYQSTYGNLSTFFLEILDRKSGDRSRVESELRTPFPLPGDQGERAWILDFRENMKIPRQMIEMTKFKNEDLGPALQIGIFSPGKGFGDPFWVLRDFPGQEETKGGSYHFTFEKVLSIPYSGLQVAYDPGTPLIWLGCSLLIVGFFISFFLDHEILWITAERETGNRIQVRIAGRAVRHPAGYARLFEKRKEAVRKSLG
jgi:cytochrome c biogenesis protein